MNGNAGFAKILDEVIKQIQTAEARGEHQHALVLRSWIRRVVKVNTLKEYPC